MCRRTIHRAILTLLAGAAIGASSPGFCQDKVTERFALLVSASYGGPSRAVLKYAEHDAESMAAVLHQLGGIPNHHLVRSSKTTPDNLRTALADLDERVRYSRRQKHRIEVLVYYSGHSNSEGLLLGEQVFPYPELKRNINALDADVKMVILDSCASGSIIRTKGVQFKPPFLVSTDRESRGSAYITSSSADEVAQESDRIKGSFFTYFFTNGLRGNADANRDLKVTLFEAYEYAFRQTLQKTKTNLLGEQHPTYDFQLSGKGDLVLTDLSQAEVVFWLAPNLVGDFFVIGADGKIQVELSKLQGEERDIGLPIGQYKVIWSQPGTMSEAVVHAGKGQKVDLAALVYTPVDRNYVVEKGDAGMPHLYKRKVFNFSLYPDLGEAGFIQDEELNHVSLGLTVGYSRKLKGFGLGLVGFIAEEESQGITLSGIFNYAKSPFKGFQYASAFNYSPVISGAQLSIANLAGTAEGLQAGLFNRAHRLTGIQVGFLNIAKEVKGFQLGLVNINESMDGVPLALLTHSRTGYRAVEGFIDPFGIPYVAYTSGTQNFVSRLFLAPHASRGRGFSWGWRQKSDAGVFNLEVGRFYYLMDVPRLNNQGIDTSHHIWRARAFQETWLFDSPYAVQWGIVVDRMIDAKSRVDRDKYMFRDAVFRIKNDPREYTYGTLFIGLAHSLTE